jgi:hypothetical protein
MADAKDIDAYGELRELMVSLVTRGVPVDDVIDAGFRLTITAVARMRGTDAASIALDEMAELVEACHEPEPPRVLH